jgi:glycylpeptide N-tetradecanoyltransferase
MEENNNAQSLPDGFKISILNMTHLDEIYEFLNNNYIENKECGLRTIFYRDYLYWYLRDRQLSIIVGLIYEQKLVGLVTAIIVEMVIKENPMKIPYLNLLCVNSKLRGLGLANFLVRKIQVELNKRNLEKCIFMTMSLTDNPKIFYEETKLVSGFKSYAVPINYPKLIEIKFLPRNCHIPNPLSFPNPLHLMKESDLECVVNKLNRFMARFVIHPIFDIKSGRHNLVPKKNIIYSFVKRDENKIVTDFISVCKSCAYSVPSKKFIYTAVVNYYYFETMTLTELVTYLIDKLESYHIDQLSFGNIALNESIQLTKYLTHYHQCFVSGIDIQEIDHNQMMLAY